jgi:hypothetical protein
MAYLRLGPNTFETRYGNWRFSADWREIECFFVTRIWRDKCVAFRLVESSPRKKRRFITSIVYGDRIDGVLPDSFGFPLEELASHLNRALESAKHDSQQ